MRTTPSPSVDVHGLTKVFTGPRPLRQVIRRPFERRRITALREVTFSASPGEVVGLIGPNGAGKTTLIKVLAGLVLPDSGEARVLGAPAGSNEARAAVGLVTAEERSFFWRISARENLRFFAALHGLPRSRADERIDELASLLELREVLDRTVREISSGNRGRLALARGMLHQPSVLLLDEVARALDPGAARRLRRLLRTLADTRELTILYAIHDLPEVRRLCDRVALLRDGSLVAAGELDSISKAVEETFGIEGDDLLMGAPAGAGVHADARGSSSAPRSPVATAPSADASGPLSSGPPAETREPPEEAAS